MKFSLISILCCCLGISGSADWIKVTLDEYSVVEFPKQPVLSDLNGTSFWEDENEGTGKCIAMITDFGAMGIDSSTLSQSMQRTAALSEVADGLLRDFKGSTVLKQERGVSEGKMYFDVYIDTGEKDAGHYNRMYYRAVVARDKLYSMYFYEDAKKPNPEMHMHFINSFHTR